MDKRILSVGESTMDITIDDVKLMHGNDVGDMCNEPYIIKKPLGRIESQGFLGIKFFSEHCYECMNCKWESPRVIIRTV